MMIKVVAFDFDGTIMDTSPGIFETALYTAKTLGWNKDMVNPIEKFVGPPLYQCFEIVFGWDRPMCDKAVEIYRPYYKSIGMYKGSLYPGMIDTLEQLRSKGYKTAIATMKYDELAKAICEHFKLTQYFDIIVGTNSESSFTKAQILGSIAKSLEVESDQVVLVGDTLIDYQGAKTAKTKFIGARYGFGLDDKEILTLDRNYYMGLVSSPKEILNYL